MVICDLDTWYWPIRLLCFVFNDWSLCCNPLPKSSIWSDLRDVYIFLFMFIDHWNSHLEFVKCTWSNLSSWDMCIENCKQEKGNFHSKLLIICNKSSCLWYFIWIVWSILTNTSLTLLLIYNFINQWLSLIERWTSSTHEHIFDTS